MYSTILYMHVAKKNKKLAVLPTKFSSDDDSGSEKILDPMHHYHKTRVSQQYYK